MKLSQEKKGKIKKHIIELAIAPQCRHSREEASKLATKIYRDFNVAMVAKLEKTDSAIKQYLDIRGWHDRVDNIYWLNHDGDLHPHMFLSDDEKEQSGVRPLFSCSGKQELLAPFVAAYKTDIDAHNARTKALAKTLDAQVKKIKNLVNSASTLNQLQESWPEIPLPPNILTEAKAYKQRQAERRKARARQKILDEMKQAGEAPAETKTETDTATDTSLDELNMTVATGKLLGQ